MKKDSKIVLTKISNNLLLTDLMNILKFLAGQNGLSQLPHLDGPRASCKQEAGTTYWSLRLDDPDHGRI